MPLSHRHAVATKPLAAAEVLIHEYEALRPTPDSAPLSALCISGGGIRSAMFGLGVIQGLAKRALLEQFDYLSTVSGGGYIGSWLTAWSKRAGGTPDVSRCLASQAGPAARGSSDPVGHLREYSRYLSPGAGAMSWDLWTLIAGVVRNILLNWLVLVPALLAVLLLPRLYLSLLTVPERLFGTIIFPRGRPVNYRAPELNVISESWFVDPLLPLCSFALFTIGVLNALRYLPGVGARQHTRAHFFLAILGPLMGAVLTFLAYDSLYYYGKNYEEYSDAEVWVALPCAFTALLLFLVFDRRPVRKRLSLIFSPLPFAIVAMALGTGIATWATANYILVNASWALYVTAGPPALLLGISMGVIVFAGLSSDFLADEDREWLSRASAGLMLAGVGWVALCCVVLILPDVMLDQGAWVAAFVVLGGAVSARLSTSSLPGASNVNPESQKRPRRGVFAGIVKLAPLGFVAALAIALSVLTNLLLVGLDTLSSHFNRAPAWLSELVVTSVDLSGPHDEHVSWSDHDEVLSRSSLTALSALAVAFLGMSWAMSRYVNINTFSLHGMYRDRLIRAYLGASNPSRRPNRFTDFDASDDTRMSELAAVRPLHIVNVTLNMVSMDRLSWQERKAASFTITPLHCGSAEIGYRDSARYAGGISLGTAIAISGAAASPNMGYYSSSLVGFIMTLFNARLGSWLGNPGPAGERAWEAAGPRSAVRSLAAEALGLTSDRSEYVYLSDGGHFENLGLYEVVRRRCRSVLVVDSGCDAEFTLGDLGNALRKIRIDFGVSIEFDPVQLQDLCGRKRRWARAIIRYSAIDPALPDGVLLYLKPMLLGCEPPDVRSYGAAHPDFPHQSTANQLFDESQTESYRQLGLSTILDALASWPGGKIDTLFDGLRKGDVAGGGE